jgi:hypothetical protein
MRRCRRPRHAFRHIAVALVLIVPSVPAWSSGRTDVSGHALLERCTNARSRAPCLGYFEAVLQRGERRLWPGQRGACPPQSFDAAQALDLFRSEARIYPEVLHVPARDLILGMLLKFFPCTGT